MTDVARLEVLICGMSVNFAEADLAVSGVFLATSVDPDTGLDVRTIIDTGHVGMRRNVLLALHERGLGPEDIHQVALTHVHWDHAQNVDLFPGAHVMVSAAEMASIGGDRARDLVTPAWTKHLFDDADVRLISPGDTIAPGVNALDAGGHTHGSLAYVVSTDEGRAVVTGDALPYAEAAVQRTGALVFDDADRSARSIVRILETGDSFYPGHDRPFTIDHGVITYLLPFSATLLGAEPSTPGLGFMPAGPHTTFDLTDGEPVGPRWTKEELA